MEYSESTFKAFYDHYDMDLIRHSHGEIFQQTLFSPIYNKVPFSVEIRMKKDVFAMQLKTDGVITMELMTVTGFYFDKYNEERACVWTRNPQNIISFFKHGISKFIELGGEISLNLDDDSIHRIVSMFQRHNTHRDMQKMLVENFKLLESKNWLEYEEYIKNTALREANEKYNGYFSENIEALKKVIPKSVSVEDIYITLGSPWVPADIIDSFIGYLFQDYSYCNHPDYKTQHDETSGTWKIPKKNRYKNRLITEKTYGTKKINALHIIEKTLNMKTVYVTDEVAFSTNKSGKKRVLNETETLLALEKQKQI